MRIHVWMAVGLVAGLVFGLIASATQSPWMLHAADALKPVGTVFFNLLSMVVIPLVAAALFSGVAGLGNMRNLGRLGVRALAFFWSTTLAGIVLGYVAARLLLPLAPITPEQQAVLRAAADTATVARSVTQAPGTVSFLVGLVPANPFRAAAEGSLLPLIVFVAIFAVATASLKPERKQVLVDLAGAVTHAMIQIVHWVLVIAPIGIFALVAPATAQLGMALIKTIALFWLSVIVGTLTLIAAVYAPLVATLGRTPLAKFFRASLPAMAMGFSTTSSLATLPTMLDTAKRDLDIGPTVRGFVLPPAAAINRAGSAVYQAAAIAFLAQLYGVPLGPSALVVGVLAVFLASLTVPSVPLGSVVSLAPALSQIGLPLAGLWYLSGIDRIPDMFRSMTNVTGHMSAVTVVAARESAPQK